MFDFESSSQKTQRFLQMVLGHSRLWNGQASSEKQAFHVRFLASQLSRPETLLYEVMAPALKGIGCVRVKGEKNNYSKYFRASKESTSYFGFKMEKQTSHFLFITSQTNMQETWLRRSVSPHFSFQRLMFILIYRFTTDEWMDAFLKSKVRNGGTKKSTQQNYKAPYIQG